MEESKSNDDDDLRDRLPKIGFGNDTKKEGIFNSKARRRSKGSSRAMKPIISNKKKASFSVEVSVKIKPFEDEEGLRNIPNTSSQNSFLVNLHESCDGFVRVGPAEGQIAQKIGRFNSVLLPHYEQQRSYNEVVPNLTEAFLHGMNCTLFVYGQTGSGKTHTLFGPPYCFSESLLSSEPTEACENIQVPPAWGIFPRCALYFLNTLKPRIEEKDRYINVGAVEVYLNQCFDLLNNKVIIPVAGYGKSAKQTTTDFLCTKTVRDKDGKWVPPFKDGKWNLGSDKLGYEASGQKWIKVRGIHGILELMSIIDLSRSAKSHALNERSSRSHCVVTVTLPRTSRSTSANPKFLFVDLAGSERIAKSGSDQCITKSAEARNINTSLTSLGRCISALASGAKFVPFRDSILTMLMKQSLGGNCRTSLIVTIAEDPAMMGETLSTLRFGKGCSRVKNTVKKVESNSLSLQDEIQETKQLLAEINSSLSALEARGDGGGINMTFPKCTRDGFLNNKQRMEQHQQRVIRLKQKLTEFISTGKQETQEYQQLQQQKQYEESQMENLKGMLIRQITTGIWDEPSKGYLLKLAAKRSAQQKLIELGENIEIEDYGVMTIDNLMVDLKRPAW